MRILLLGATGRTGQKLLTEALNAGFQVTALVRDKRNVNITSDRLTILENPDLDSESLRTAIQGCSAVLSTLNISRTSDFPWSRLRTPTTFLSDLLTQLIPICAQHNVSRLILTTAWGVRETKPDIPFWFRWLIDYSNIGVAYRDHERQEEILEQSALDWTVVRPTGLTNGNRPKRILESAGNQPKPNLTISRANVARFMVSVLRDHRYSRQAVTISEA